MIRTVVFGAGGRMGRRLVTNIMANEGMELAGAVEIPSSPFIGQDAGALAGCGEAGVKIVDSAAEAVKPGVDAVIIFATGGVVDCAKLAVSVGAAAVIGTTALSDADRAALRELVNQSGRIVIANNMSVGVNLLFKLVKEAAAVLDEQFNVEIVEMHHNKKIDAPSGTAVRLAEVVCEARDWDYKEVVRAGRDGVVGKRPEREIGMHSLRGGDVVGDHTVVFAADGERVELTHKASSRDTFARGALLAVEFLSTAKPGIYDMQDVLKLK